jgi:hypothetical protein
MTAENLPRIELHLSADTSGFTQSVTDVRMQLLNEETGIPAAIWREVYNVAGSEKMFETVLKAWRESFATTAIDPRTVAATLKYAMESE